MNVQDPFNLLRTKIESIGKPPGTISYSGSYTDVELQIDVITYDENQYQFTSYKDSKEIGNILADAQSNKKVCWINIVGLHNQTMIHAIGDILQVHPMDLEDIVQVSHWSKILNQDRYLFSILKMIFIKKDLIIHEHLSVIVKEHIILTFQETPGDVFDHVRNRLRQANGQLRLRSSNYLFYSLLDAIVDEYIVVVNNISLRFNTIEMQIIDGNHPNKEDLYELKKELLYFSNSVSPLLDSVRHFVSEDNSFYTNEMGPYYADLHDHLNQIFDSIKAYREMSNSLHEMHMSNVSMRMNRTMMTLTVFSAIFIPLSFLAGVFGMNFISVPGLSNPAAFIYFVFFCIVLAGSMFAYFKRKEWF